jgi:hypothetical protein
VTQYIQCSRDINIYIIILDSKKKVEKKSWRRWRLSPKVFEKSWRKAGKKSWRRWRLSPKGKSK